MEARMAPLLFASEQRAPRRTARISAVLLVALAGAALLFDVTGCRGGAPATPGAVPAAPPSGQPGARPPGTRAGTIPCGDKPCQVGTEVCCAISDGERITSACVPFLASGDGYGAALARSCERLRPPPNDLDYFYGSCDDSTDCVDGAVCCPLGPDMLSVGCTEKPAEECFYTELCAGGPCRTPGATCEPAAPGVRPSPRACGPSRASVRCGKQECPPDRPVCCWGEGATPSCQPAGARCAELTFPYACDGSDDCPQGTRCCGSADGAMGTSCRFACEWMSQSVTCRAAADCRSPDPRMPKEYGPHPRCQAAPKGPGGLRFCVGDGG
jgi:hypothetical protein